MARRASNRTCHTPLGTTAHEGEPQRETGLPPPGQSVGTVVAKQDGQAKSARPAPRVPACAVLIKEGGEAGDEVGASLASLTARWVGGCAEPMSPERRPPSETGL